ncbi:MAG TPA: DUF1501 domain-containing protein [Gemmataceae bacterium]|jgi:uncharacterized protein (DUF1501 family)|nr:DUF1501 domain-containing protein [Gemmataceae bacterium]
MLSRRDFLKHSSLLALAPTVPGFLAQTARAAKTERDGRVLVVIQLDGGNDGINTVVPFADPGYAKHRKVLRLPKDRLVKVNDQVGLHPSLADAGKLFEAGRLAIVQGVSYPNPNRSHFRSMAIWHAARLDAEEHGGLGWLGRALDDNPRTAGGAASSLLIGSGPPPVALRGRRAVASAMERLDDFALASGADPRKAISSMKEPADDLTAFVRRSMLDAYATADRLAEVTKARDTGARYPDSGLGQRLQMIARLLKVGFGSRVYYTVQGSYDTHSAQLQTHSQLLFELATGLKAFLDDLAASRLADRVAVLIFSEFGRTVSENGSAGTDHGTSAPVFLAGPGVKAGLVGTTPSLLDLDEKNGDLKMNVDFREVYASVLEDWLQLPAKDALGSTFKHLPLFRS